MDTSLGFDIKRNSYQSVNIRSFNLNHSENCLKQETRQIQAGDIGWGVLNKNLTENIKICSLKEQPHKRAFNQGQPKFNLKMNSIGEFQVRVDRSLNISTQSIEHAPLKL